jgi:ATP-binding cassette, subfamily C (CFTR/MRP), member 1
MTELSEGNLFVDGHNTSEFARDQLRSRITSIPQESFALTGTIRFNLDVTNTIDDAVLRSAFVKVGLWDVIEENGGLDASIDALHLSHGQQQLFSLARAVTRKSSILVLDEATSNVDHETERKMLDIVKEVFWHATIIAVAHRLNTIVDYDRVIVIEQGRITESGNPTLLLQRESKFRELYDKQNR